MYCKNCGKEYVQAVAGRCEGCGIQITLSQIIGGNDEKEYVVYDELDLLERIKLSFNIFRFNIKNWLILVGIFFVLNIFPFIGQFLLLLSIPSILYFSYLDVINFRSRKKTDFKIFYKILTNNFKYVFYLFLNIFIYLGVNLLLMFIYINLKNIYFKGAFIGFLFCGFLLFVYSCFLILLLKFDRGDSIFSVYKIVLFYVCDNFFLLSGNLILIFMMYLTVSVFTLLIGLVVLSPLLFIFMSIEYIRVFGQSRMMIRKIF